jgi:hypothetical protein
VCFDRAAEGSDFDSTSASNKCKRAALTIGFFAVSPILLHAVVDFVPETLILPVLRAVLGGVHGLEHCVRMVVEAWEGEQVLYELSVEPEPVVHYHFPAEPTV